MTEQRKRPLVIVIFLVLMTLTVLFRQKSPKQDDLGAPPAPRATIDGCEPFGGFDAHSVPRSGKWPTVRKHYLELHPNCEACGRTAAQSGQAIECHHCIAFSEDASKELDPDNLISLCRRCHGLLGHLDLWASHNPDIREDARRMLKKIKERP